MKKILISLLTLTVIFFTASCFSFTITGEFSYDDDGYVEYSVFTESEKDLSAIKKVNIEWISGKTEIKSGQFSFTDEAIRGEFFPSYYKISDDELFIKYAKNGTTNAYLNGKDKKLSVAIPSSVEVVELTLVSADYDISLPLLNSLLVTGVSGEGNISVGALKSGQVSTVSGNTTANLSTVSLEEFYIASISGNGEIGVDLLKKATVDFSSLSGKLTDEISSLPALSEDEYKIGFGSISGNLKIKLISF